MGVAIDCSAATAFCHIVLEYAIGYCVLARFETCLQYGQKEVCVRTGFLAFEIGSIEAAKVDGSNGKQIFAFIEFPQIAPHFYKSIGSGISLNFKLMVAAEVLAQTAKSIGQMLNSSKVYFEIAEMTALVVVSVAIGVIIEFIFNKISEKSSEWK